MTSPPSADGVWRKLRLVPQLTAPDLALQADDLAAVVVEGGMLRWVGPTGSVPAAYAALPQFDGGGALRRGRQGGWRHRLQRERHARRE